MSRATNAPGESQFPGTPSAVRRSCSWIHTSNARSRRANSSVTWSPSGPRTIVAGSRFSFRSCRERRMTVYSSSEVISGAVWWRRTSTCTSMYRLNSSTTCRRSLATVWIGRGSPSCSHSMPMMCDTTSRTDQPGQGVARFHSPSVSGRTNSDIASMECVHASA